MFSKSELQVIEILVALQISASKEKLRHYRSCGMYERLDGCRQAIKQLEELRAKAVCLESAVEQIKINKV